jgi:hypothetical protein
MSNHQHRRQCELQQKATYLWAKIHAGGGL